MLNVVFIVLQIVLLRDHCDVEEKTKQVMDLVWVIRCHHHPVLLLPVPVQVHRHYHLKLLLPQSLLHLYLLLQKFLLHLNLQLPKSLPLNLHLLVDIAIEYLTYLYFFSVKYRACPRWVLSSFAVFLLGTAWFDFLLVPACKPFNVVVCV